MNYDRKQRIDLPAASWLQKALRPHQIKRPAQAADQACIGGQDDRAPVGHTKNASVTNGAGEARNGKSKKTLKGDFGISQLTGTPALSHRS